MDEYQKTYEYQKKVSEYIKMVDFSNKKRMCMSKTEIELIRKLRESHSLQGVFSLILFSIISDGDNSVRYLFNSIVKQRKFISLLQSAILYTEIKKEDICAFENEVKRISNRTYKIKLTMDEILKETIYYPYYKSIVGKDFEEIILTENFRNDSVLFSEKSKEYNEKNKEEYQEHLVVMNELIEKRNKFRTDKRYKIEAEKKAIKNLKRKEKEEIKEIKENKKKYKKLDKKLGIAGNSYYYK